MGWTFALTVLLSSLVTLVSGEVRLPQSRPPCGLGPFGGEFEFIGIPATLESMISASDLIVIGRVTRELGEAPIDEVLPTTEFLVSVNEILHSRFPQIPSTIVLQELGSIGEGCRMTVRENVLVQTNEAYVLFLRTDPRKSSAATTSELRFIPVGNWSGKARIINGKIRFLPSVAPMIRKMYTDADVAQFIKVVKTRIRGIFFNRPGPTGILYEK
jgi:hypothetical protein